MIVPLGPQPDDLLEESVAERPFVTVAIAFAVLFAYVASVAGRTPDQALRVALQWGFNPDRPIEPGLLTYPFLHGDVWHMLANAWFVLAFGTLVECKAGHIAAALTYALAALAGAAGFLLTAAPLPGAFIHLDAKMYAPLVGASSVICGFLGAWLPLAPRTRIRLALGLLGVRWKVVPVPAWIFAGLFVGTEAAFGLASAAGPSLHAYVAHAGGTVVGVLLGFAVLSRLADMELGIYYRSTGRKRPPKPLPALSTEAGTTGPLSALAPSGPVSTPSRPGGRSRGVRARPGGAAAGPNESQPMPIMDPGSATLSELAVPPPVPEEPVTERDAPPPPVPDRVSEPVAVPDVSAGPDPVPDKPPADLTSLNGIEAGARAMSAPDSVDSESHLLLAGVRPPIQMQAPVEELQAIELPAGPVPASQDLDTLSGVWAISPYLADVQERLNRARILERDASKAAQVAHFYQRLLTTTTLPPAHRVYAGSRLARMMLRHGDYKAALSLSRKLLVHQLPPLMKQHLENTHRKAHEMLRLLEP